MLVNYVRNIFRISIILIVFFNASLGFAQCAGIGGEITICEKETDPSLQTFKLFDVLAGETPGGIWVPENAFDANFLDPNTGLVDLWQINRNGVHVFTYSNPSCDQSTASVTIYLGGYPGENNQNPPASVCQEPRESNSTDLFTHLGFIENSTRIPPDLDGIWEEDSGNQVLGVLSGSTFIFSEIPLGTYTFTYTVPEVNGCPSRSVIVDIEVWPGVFPGIPMDLNLCSTDDMSAYTNLDLYSRLEDEDLGGQWTDVSSVNTGQITGTNDHEINVEEIYNTYGAGVYVFKYDLVRPYVTCKPKNEEFTLCIQEFLVGSLSVDSCQKLATLTYDRDVLNNGTYTVDYTISGGNFGTRSFQAVAGFGNGIARFGILDGLNISGNLNIKIDAISPRECGFTTSCFDIPSVNFIVNKEPIITVSSTSGCELDDILVTINGAENDAFQVLNGQQSVSYSVSGVNYNEDLRFVNGNAILRLPANRFAQPNNSVVFFNSNNFVHCDDITVTPNLVLIPPPPNPIFSIVPKNDRCDVQTLQFGFDSPSGQFVTYSSVTFDIYQYGTEPNQFDPRNPNTSLTNNTLGSGIDIDITDSNGVTSFPDGDYVFVIRSVQNDNEPCRGLSQAEIDAYAAQGIEIGLTKVGNQHIFDARMTFRIGEPLPVALVKKDFEVCLSNGPVTLGELSLYAGQDVDITVTDLLGGPLADSYNITKDETFIAVFKSAVTGCDLNSEQFNVKIVTEPSAPNLNENVFCSLQTPTVADLDVSGQNIVWYDAAIGGNTYNNIEFIDNNNKQYWAEIVINGGCVSPTRTRAPIEFIDKPIAPTALPNSLCSVEKLTISDLQVQSIPGATLQWYTSATGPAYASVALPLDSTKQYWVSQTIVEGCESDRVEVKFTLGNVTTIPVPLNNDFCTETGTVYTIDNLSYTPESISSEGTLLYFTDAAGMNAIPAGELLTNLTSPIYVQQVITGTCFSAIARVNFTLQGRALSPTLSPAVFCSVDNPTIQDLEARLESQTSVNITLYADSTTSVVLDGNLDLKTFTGTIYASQTIVNGCESTERTLVIPPNFIDKAISPVPNINEFCSNTKPTIADLSVESDPFATLQWYTSATGPAYSSTSLLLDQANEYWVSQILGSGCESDRVQVDWNPDGVTNLEPVNNDFCLLVASTFTLKDLNYNNVSESSQVEIKYFSDQSGANSLSSDLLLTSVLSPVYAQKVILGTCASEIVVVNFTLQGRAVSPTFTQPIFCSSDTPTIQDVEARLETQTSVNITLYADDSTSVVLDGNLDLKSYTGEIYASQTIVNGCESTERTLVIPNFIDKAISPVPLTNEFCANTTPTIADLSVESDPFGTLQWYTSSTGPAYSSTSLPLDQANQYWVSQSLGLGCESDRVEVTYTTPDVITNPEPANNDFCLSVASSFTLEDLQYNNVSESDQVVIEYFSDQDGNNPLSSDTLLSNVSSPTYARKVISGSCSSEIVPVNFTLQGVAPAPTLSSITLCKDNNPTIQDLILALEEQTSTDIVLYADEFTTSVLDISLPLGGFLSGQIYASQTIVAGCESTDRASVTFDLAELVITDSDFNSVFCSSDQVRLNEVYIGTTGTILWFDSSNTPLLGTEIVQEGVAYYAQLQVNSCLSNILELTFNIIDVLDPVGSPVADFCGVQYKTIADLSLEDDIENSPQRFNIPSNHFLVWYDSNDISARNQLSDDTVLQHGTTYFAVYETEETIGNISYTCESNPFAVIVNLTDCSLQIKELIIPDAFSPNGDNVNDTFELLNIPFIFPDYSIEIYNRYGRVVFKGNLEIGYWDGKSNQPGFRDDEVLPTGVYFYVIKFNRFGEEPRQGQVYLKR